MCLLCLKKWLTHGRKKVLYGSTLHLLVHVVLQESPQANLTYIWEQIKKAYTLFDVDARLRFSSMKLTSFAAKGGAKLKGPTAIIRALGTQPPCVCVCFVFQAMSAHSCLRGVV